MSTLTDYECHIVVKQPVPGFPIPESEFYNIYNGPSGYHKRLIENALDKRILCNGLNRESIKSLLDDCWFFIYLTKDDTNVHGLLIVKPNDQATPGAVEIDFLCGSMFYLGAGTILLNILTTIMESMGKSRIILDSVEGAITFYTKRGFKPSNTPSENRSLTRMVKNSISSKTNTTGGRRRTRRTRRTRKC